MGKEKIISLLTSFTPNGDFLAIASPDGLVKVWNTKNGSLQTEWKDQDGDLAGDYSCIKCGFVRKKHKKERGTFLLALGTYGGDVLAINILTGEKKWKSNACHTGGVTALAIGNNGRILHSTGANGVVFELDSETGELKGRFKASKGSISSLTLSCDEKILALASMKIRLFSLETKTQLQKFSRGPGIVQHIALSEDGKALVFSLLGEKQLQVWNFDGINVPGNVATILSMRSPPVMLECRKSWREENGVVVLSVSEAGIAYVWHLTSESQDEVVPTRIIARSSKTETDGRSNSKKNRVSIIGAMLHNLEKGGRTELLVAYGSSAKLQFNLVEVTGFGEEIFITAADEALESTRENGDLGAKVSNHEIITDNSIHNPELEATAAPSQKKKVKKKRAASEAGLANSGISVDDGHLEVPSEAVIDYDMSEPTMGEKLASLNLLDDAKMESPTKDNFPSNTMLPSADSVHVLLKQALHADDHTLLLECLYTLDEKVIKNSTSLLCPSDVLKFLKCLISMISSRGAVLVCVIPWLRSLLLQQATCIMSQESSLYALNSLYQLIESRVSTFAPALELSGYLDLLFSEVSGDVGDDSSMVPAVIYEDNDNSDGDLTDAMDTDEESEELEAFSAHNNSEESDGSDD